MGLNSALVDRARVVTKRAAGGSVDGETVYADTYGPWFRVRVQLGTEGESIDEATGERQVNRTPSLMVALRNEDGDPVVLNVEDRIEVSSRELPDYISSVWDVISDPQPMRKKRKVIGWNVTARRVQSHPNAG